MAVDGWAVTFGTAMRGLGTGRGRSPPSPLLAVATVTVHPSTANVPITVLLYNGPLLGGFNVPIKGLQSQIADVASNCTQYILPPELQEQNPRPDHMRPPICSASFSFVQQTMMTEAGK